MNILLIGNGFDLEHKLPTSYKDFLEFCKRLSRIFSYNVNLSADDYRVNNLDNWEINDYVKEILYDAFDKRKAKEVKCGTKKFFLDVAVPNELLNELYSNICKNAWMDYFYEFHSLGENWIDFESEISKVIQALDFARIELKRGGKISDLSEDFYTKVEDIIRSVGLYKDNYPFNVLGIDIIVRQLDEHLRRLIRALEIYISEIVENIEISKKSSDIEKLNPDRVLSFNYSNTYERLYGKEKSIIYDYIHGKACVKNDIETSELVLGIDEYLDDNRKNSDLKFLAFKKYYQRIIKSTDNAYLDWIDEIKSDYSTTNSVKNTPHFLYIFGHSLDVTDKDVLEQFICNDNVQTRIFYHQKSKNDKTVLGKVIENLVKIIGQEELIRRTGGKHKTIEFIPQSINRENELI